MKLVRLIPILCLLALASGCLMSEQFGGPIGEGRNRRPAEDVTIHFDTTFNRVLIFGRAALLVGFAAWVVSSWGARPAPIVVGGVALAAAGWFTINDVRALKGYALDVAEAGLTMSVPGSLDEQIPWSEIEELELEGFSYARIGGGMQYTPGVGMTRKAGIELPDWKTMRLTTTAGTTHTVKLSELSIEHRQIFASALIKRADLVDIEEE